MSNVDQRLASIEDLLRKQGEALATIATSQADHQARIGTLERARGEHASKTEVDQGDLKAANAIIDLHGRVGDLRSYVGNLTLVQERAADGRITVIMGGLVAVAIIVVVGALVARGVLDPSAFVPTAVTLATGMTALLSVKRNGRKTELGKSIPPEEG